MSPTNEHYQSFSKKVAVNLITGALGAGKTTLIRNFLSQKPSNEQWGLLVNEFGAIGIDGAILTGKDNVEVTQIPGGCICCTAKSELKTAISTLLQTQNLDRLIIEPTGLGEPDTLVDLLQSDFFAERFDIQTVFSVFDSQSTTVAEFNEYTILQNLAHMADVVIFNKTDIAQSDTVKSLIQYAEALYPPKQQIITTQHAQVNISLLSLAHSDSHIQSKQTWGIQSISEHASHAQNPQSTELPYTPIELTNLSQRLYQKQLNTQSIGWIFSPTQAFEWTKLLSLFQSFNQQPGFSNIKRAKGVFKVGDPWMLFQWANGQVTREYIAYRRDSRLEILFESDTQIDFVEFEKKLQTCYRQS